VRDEPPDALVFEYHLDEQLPLTVVPAYRHIERWNVTVLAEDVSSERHPAEIGYAHVLVFNMEPGDDISDFADRTSGTWIDRPAAGQSRSISESDSEVMPRSTHVLLLDRVWLSPDFRGLGLGPIIAAAVIERLGRGCHVAACYPAPFDNPTQQPDDRDRSIEALGKLWSAVGFTHFRDGVWMLDLESGSRHAALARLLAARRGCDNHANPVDELSRL
jgi:hypothetical protein